MEDEKNTIVPDLGARDIKRQLAVDVEELAQLTKWLLDDHRSITLTSTIFQVNQAFNTIPNEKSSMEVIESCIGDRLILLNREISGLRDLLDEKVEK